MLPKLGFFTWETTWDGIITIDQLKKWGWTMVNKCSFCKDEEELTSHLFVHCTRTRILWQLVFSLFQIEWLMPTSVKGTLLSWHGSFVGKRRKKAWRVVPSCIVWIFWGCGRDRSNAKIVLFTSISGLGEVGLNWNNNIHGRPSQLDGCCVRGGVIVFCILLSLFCSCLLAPLYTIHLLWCAVFHRWC